MAPLYLVERAGAAVPARGRLVVRLRSGYCVAMRSFRLAIVVGVGFVVTGVSACSSTVMMKTSSDTTGGDTTSSSASSSGSSGGGAGGGGADGGGADGGVPACSGPPKLATVGEPLLPKTVTPCPSQAVYVYGDQIACEGIAVTIGGLEAPLVAYVTPYPNDNTPGVALTMPQQDGGIVVPDGGTLAVKVVVTNAFGSDTSTGDLTVLSTQCSTGP
jgi:hypothetical protein